MAFVPPDRTLTGAGSSKLLKTNVVIVGQATGNHPFRLIDTFAEVLAKAEAMSSRP